MPLDKLSRPGSLCRESGSENEYITELLTGQAIRNQGDDHSRDEKAEHKKPADEGSAEPSKNPRLSKALTRERCLSAFAEIQAHQQERQMKFQVMTKFFLCLFRYIILENVIECVSFNHNPFFCSGWAIHWEV